jgi:hypothetical protein
MSFFVMLAQFFSSSFRTSEDGFGAGEWSAAFGGAIQRFAPTQRGSFAALQRKADYLA